MCVKSDMVNPVPLPALLFSFYEQNSVPDYFYN